MSLERLRSPEQSVGRLLLVCGLPCVGKTTSINYALNKNPDRLEFMKSYTTRPRRIHEGDSEYYFVDDTTFDIVGAQVGLDWEESTNYQYRYGQDTAYFKKQMKMGKFVIGCCRPSIDEIESLYPFYEPSTIHVVHITIPEDVRIERVLATRGEMAVARLREDAGWHATPEFSQRVNTTIELLNDLPHDLEMFNGVISSIIDTENP